MKEKVGKNRRLQLVQKLTFCGQDKILGFVLLFIYISLLYLPFFNNDRISLHGVLSRFPLIL